MNIKEYIKIQADECKNDSMRVIFTSLKEKFFPTPIDKSKSVVVYDKPVTVNKTVNTDNFYKRKVRVHLPNDKTSIGLIDSDGYDIKLPNKEKLTFCMITDNISYYYGFERLFYKESNSRIVHMIDASNYQKHYANVCWVKDYALEDNERVRIY